MASALHYVGSKLTKEIAMNIKAALASLVLGSSSVAMAAPAVTVTAHGSLGTPAVRDHRFVDDSIDPVTGERIAQPIYMHTSAPVDSRPIYRAPWRRPIAQPVTLASGLRFQNTGRTFISVGDQLGRFGSLQINAAGGRTFIKQVYVQFDNGQTQVVRNLNRTLTGNDSLTVDLDGNRRGIRRIVVYGSDINSGWRRSSSAFTVTAV
jgi:hypothetical protein